MQISKLSLALGIAVGALTAGTFAWAAVPDSVGTIHACAGTKNGALRVGRPHAKALKCGKKERALVWSKQGPAGLPGTVGPAGPAGPKGDTGEKGAAGLVGIHGVEQASTFTTTGLHVANAQCPSGEEVLTSGYSLWLASANGENLGTPSGAVRIEASKAVNKNAPGSSSFTGSGLVALTLDASKLPAGKFIRVYVELTCAQTA